MMQLLIQTFEGRDPLVLRGCLHFVEKHWGLKSVRVISGTGTFSEVLLDGIRSTDGPFFHLLDDHWLSRIVPSDALMTAASWIRVGCDSVRFDADWHHYRMTNEKPWSPTFRDRRLDSRSHYLSSFQPTLYADRSRLERYLVREESPWQAEIQGTKRLKAFRPHVRIMPIRIREDMVHRGSWNLDSETKQSMHAEASSLVQA